MNTFQAHVLRFVCEATSPIYLREHKGSALRGAFFHALRADFCVDHRVPSCQQCSQRLTCPVCFLASTVDDSSERGLDIPRPYVIEPPLDSRLEYRPGDTFEFNITLFSRALTTFPYVILATRRMGEIGLGTVRGRFSLREVWAVNQLTGVQQRVHHHGDDLVKVPDIPITHEQVLEMAEVTGKSSLPDGLALKARFKTPLRLTTDGRLVHRLGFATFVRRLLERLSVLAGACAREDLPLEYAELLAKAERVSVVADDTRWLEVNRYSSRQARPLPMGGLVGDIVFAGDLAPFLPWLIWGSIVHVGKYAVMGNGMFDVRE